EKGRERQGQPEETASNATSRRKRQRQRQLLVLRGRSWPTSEAAQEERGSHRHIERRYRQRQGPGGDQVHGRPKRPDYERKRCDQTEQLVRRRSQGCHVDQELAW